MHRGISIHRNTLLTILAAILLTLLFLHGAYYLWAGIATPALDHYAFRQTQTALSAYWLWHDGFQFPYQTPVVGAPWAIPFEFPLYQWLVALLRVFGVPIDVGGRLVSFGFYIAILYPLWILNRELGLSRLVWVIVAALFLASPLYVFWGRSVMMESCALFFAVLMLALIAQYLNNGRMLTLVLAFVAGTLSVLTKSTTFPGYAFLAGLLVLAHAFADYRRGGRSALDVRQLASVFGALVLVLLVGFVWVWYTDSVKSQNPIGVYLTSSAISFHNFGSWDERFSAAFWRGTILNRALPQIIGYASLVAVIAAAAALQSRRHGLLMLAALVGFLLPMVVFSHLHVVHHYYQLANGLLVLLAVGLGIAVIAERGQPLVAALMLGAILVGQILFFQTQYAPVVSTDQTKNPIFVIARAAKNATPEDAGLIVLGDDWSSEVPYYAERKSIAVPNWLKPDLTKKILDDPERFLGGRELGGIIYCGDGSKGKKGPLYDAAVEGRELIAQAGPCRLFAPTR